MKANDIEAREVHELLDQLGLPTHYLGDKPIDAWDEYDHSNYRALQIKGGKLKRVYGIFDASISQEEAHIVTSPPSTHYNSYWQAKEAMADMIENRGFHSSRLRILSLYIKNS